MSNRGKKSTLPHLFDTIEGTSFLPFLENPDTKCDIGQYTFDNIWKEWQYYDTHCVVTTLCARINNLYQCEFIVEFHYFMDDYDNYAYREFIMDANMNKVSVSLLFAYDDTPEQDRYIFVNEHSIISNHSSIKEIRECNDYDIVKAELIALNDKEKEMNS
jgi:hypothetical protein